MPEISTHMPENFSDIMRCVEVFQDARHISWYRGNGNHEYKLLPSIFRHSKKRKIVDIHDIEKDLAIMFEQRSPPFVQQAFKNEWDQMFFMQHYGIPTRLLDWTESPFIAMYFALTSCERDGRGKPRHDAAIWMLDPIMWNQGALSDISYKGGVLDSNREQVKGYSPRSELEERKNLPIMIFGTHNSPRIVAQRGMFALFGKSVKPMEELVSNAEVLNDALQKIIIKKSIRDSVATSLFRKGIADSTIYPDLHGLSLELKRTYGF